MAVPIKPTKSNLLKTKENLKFAQQGYELLEQKKEVLMMEFMSQIHKLKRLSIDIFKKFNDIRENLKYGIALSGKKNFEELIQNFRTEIELNVTEMSVMGVYIPSITVKKKEFDILKNISLVSSNHYLNKCSIEMGDLIEQFIEWIEVKTSIVKLAEEIKKNNRRVNALDNIFIPQYKNTIKKISEILEEQEKEEFFRMKKIKAKLNLKKEENNG